MCTLTLSDSAERRAAQKDTSAGGVGASGGAESRTGHVKIDAKRGPHQNAFRAVVDLPKRRKREARSRRGDRGVLSAPQRLKSRPRLRVILLLPCHDARRVGYVGLMQELCSLLYLAWRCYVGGYLFC